jgi:hypothetical protein
MTCKREEKSNINKEGRNVLVTEHIQKMVAEKG